MIELTCPACENRLAIEESQLGGFVLCPHCNVQLDLTDDEPPAPQAQPQQTSSKKRVVLKKNTGSTGGPVIHTQGSGAPYQPAPPPSGPIPVKITGVSMGFGEMVAFQIKWAIASIPAMIIVSIIVGILYALVFGAVLMFAS